MVRKLSGSGGIFGGDSAPTETDDNLFSTDIVEAILGVSEGPIKGLKDGPKSFLLADTPLKNVNNENNFDSFELVVRKGSDLGEPIVSRMGGFASSTTVGTEMASEVPIVRQGTHTEIDYLDIRLVINRLLRSTDDGTFNHTGRIKIEYKQTASSTWIPLTTVSDNPPPQQQIGINTDVFSELVVTDRVAASPGDRQVYLQSATPPIVVGEATAIWFKTSESNRPYTIVSNAWVAIPGAVLNGTTWTWTEASSWGTDRYTNLFVGTVPPEIRDQGDYWLSTDNNRVYMFNGSSWIVAGSSLAPGGFGSGTTIPVAGEIHITGKTTTSFVKEFRFPITNTADDTYQIRITKLNPPNTAEDFFDVTWESFQEVTAEPMIFPGLATVQLTARASEQFSSIPQFSGIYQGRVIRVPTNYDPVERTYSGLWDGTWKLAYSNNPAYIVYDLVSNDRYGLNAYYPVVLNKWDVYDAGVWCDTRTAENVPRFTFNQLIDTARSCREAIDYICGIFGGRFFDDGNGSANIRIDKPENAAGIFTPENVVDGIFSYSFTDISGRYNDITVTFKNPELNYKEDRRRVFQQDHIDKYGRIPLNFIAIGCNSSVEAITRARYKLVTGLGETAIVNFKTNRQGLYYAPYDIILIVDEDMNSGLSGRVKEFIGPKTFTLRDPIYLEPGFNYKVMFQIPDGLNNKNFIVLEREIAPGTSGLFDRFTTVTDLPDLPDQAVFTISTVDNTAAPRPFRITRIDEVDGDPDNVEIQAIEVNRIKWDFVDGLIEDYEEPEQRGVDTGNRTQPVPALRIRAFNTLSGSRTVHNVLLDWDPSPTKTANIYKVYVSKDNGPQSLLAETGIYSFEWNDIIPGEYLFSVIAVSTISGSLSESKPTTIEHRFIGDVKDPQRVTDLHMIDEAAPPIYARRSPSFDWTPVSDPRHRDYVVRIYDYDTGVLVGEHFTRESSYVYDYETNRADHGGVAARNFSIGVASRDQFGGVSAFNIIDATNPPPAVTTPIIEGGVSSAVISWVTTGITDYLGAKIWVGTTADFPLNPLYLKYDGGGNNFTFLGTPGTTYYLRIALFDNFNQTDYVISDAISFVVNGVNIEDVSEIFSTPLGYISDDGGSGLAARLNDLETKLDNSAIAISKQGIADWAQRESVKRSLVKQGAKFEEEINVLVTADQALSNRITTFEADLDDAHARITTEETARATADSAMAGTLTTITSELDDANARITTEELTRATADTALSSTLSTVQTQVNDTAAAVVTETTARISADEAIATSITEVAAEMDGFSASGRAGFQVSATPAGATARYAIVVRANTASSYVTSGFYLDIMADASTRAAIQADSFYLLSNVGGYLAAPFYVDSGNVFINNAHIRNITADKLAVTSLAAISATLGNVVVHGDLLVLGTVTTGKVAANAITFADMFIYNSFAGPAAFDNTEHSIISGLSIDASGYEVIIRAHSRIVPLGGGDCAGYYRLKRNGVAIAEKLIEITKPGDSMLVSIQSGAGVYSLTVQRAGGPGIGADSNAIEWFIRKR